MTALDDATLSDQAAANEAVKYLLQQVETRGGELVITRTAPTGDYGWRVEVLTDHEPLPVGCRVAVAGVGDDLPSTLQMVASDLGEVYRQRPVDDRDTCAECGWHVGQRGACSCALPRPTRVGG